jgi:hypothetical protein
MMLAHNAKAGKINKQKKLKSENEIKSGTEDSTCIAGSKFSSQESMVSIKVLKLLFSS